MFRIISSPIDSAAEGSRLSHSASGALITFEGRVRNHHKGKSVTALEYEAFHEMAETEGTRLLQEAVSRFEILDARGVHRTGHLTVGEAAVWIGVLASHRKEGFAACSWIMDELKQRVPIWKKEIFEDGVSEWVQGAG